MRILEETDLRALFVETNGPTNLERKLAALLEESFSRGEPIVLEGIGTVSRGGAGQICVEPWKHPRVFLAYAVEDISQVRSIFRFLKTRGFEPWMDVECLLPGQNWPRAIERAIESADFVVPCFSKVSTSKRGFFQAELRYALDCAVMRPLDEIYLVPVRLEPCRVPSTIQRRTQYVDLFPEPESGLARLLKTLRSKALPKGTGD